MTSEWSNWSGSVRFEAGRIARPRSEAALAELVGETQKRGGTLRAIGSGHSSSAIMESGGCTLVSVEHIGAIEACDAARREAWIGPGARLKELGQALLDRGLALHNYGDVDVQTLGGVIATGTHGTGVRIRNLATMLTGARLVTGRGEVVEFLEEREPDAIRGLRVSLGALGICSAVRVRLVEAFELQRREWCAPFEPALALFGELAESIRNVDLYWYPRSDEVKLRTLDLPGRLPERVRGARLLKDECGWAADVLPRTRELRFEEMEYAVPAEAGPACMRDVRDRVLKRHRREVAWRVLYRTVAADDAFLSPAHGRDVVTISLHHNAGLPFAAYFDDVEPIFRKYGGRPHWAKKYALAGESLRELYPKWDEFMALRGRLDPDGAFLSPALRRLFGLESVR